METLKIIYWVSTVLVGLTFIYGAYSDLRSKEVREAFVHLGFPAYFRVELGVMKLIGVVLLLAPLPVYCKEWAYVGFAITLVSAFIAHTASGDKMSMRMVPLTILVFTLISYFSFHHL